MSFALFAFLLGALTQIVKSFDYDGEFQLWKRRRERINRTEIKFPRTKIKVKIERGYSLRRY
jgi:hypothetical protein